MSLMMMLTLTVVRFMALFVDADAYNAKIAAIPTMERKHDGFDLAQWQYLSTPAGNGEYAHRYYYKKSPSKDARTLLLVHGLNLDGRTYMNLAPLAERWNLLAYDLPERCPLYRGEYADWRAIINDFVDHCPDSLAGVAGVSFGGGIAMHLAANHPRLRNTALILISTTMINESNDQRAQTTRMANWIGKLPDYKIYWVMETMVARSEKELARDAASGLPDVRRILGMKHPDYYRQVAVSLKSYRAAEDARKVSCPVLMLMGDKDDLYKTEQESMMKRFIAHIDYRVIRGGGHSMVYTMPGEVCTHIEDFFSNAIPFTNLE